MNLFTFTALVITALVLCLYAVDAAPLSPNVSPTIKLIPMTFLVVLAVLLIANQAGLIATTNGGTP